MIDDELWDSLYPKITSEKPKIIITSTPKGSNSWLSDYCDNHKIDIIKEKNDIRKNKLESI